MSGLWHALLASIFISFFNTVLTTSSTSMTTISVDQLRVERLARQRTYEVGKDPKRGLVMLEIDGLSYWHMQHAIEKGYLPTLREMMEEDGYQLSRVDCGLPSRPPPASRALCSATTTTSPLFAGMTRTATEAQCLEP